MGVGGGGGARSLSGSLGEEGAAMRQVSAPYPICDFHKCDVHKKGIITRMECKRRYTSRQKISQRIVYFHSPNIITLQQTLLLVDYSPSTGQEHSPIIQ